MNSTFFYMRQEFNTSTDKVINSQRLWDLLWVLKKPYFFHDLWKNRWMTVAFMIMGIEINA